MPCRHTDVLRWRCRRCCGADVSGGSCCIPQRKRCIPQCKHAHPGTNVPAPVQGRTWGWASAQAKGVVDARRYVWDVDNGGGGL